MCTLPLVMYGANTTAASGTDYSGAEFVPAAVLRAAGDAEINYLIDDPSLPFDPLPPPRGVPQQLAEELDRPADDGARYGTFDQIPGTGIHAPFIPRRLVGPDLVCPPDAPRIGGDGFAFVLQSAGVDAAGCAGTGLGYASNGSSCTARLNNSLAVQFDVHRHARIIVTEKCIDTEPGTYICRPGALQRHEEVVYDRDHAVSVYVGGSNALDGEALNTHLLGKWHNFRFDDGEPHEARVVYWPPKGSLEHGRFEVYLYGGPQEGDRHPTITIPLTLDGSVPGILGASTGGAGTAYVGITAATGQASQRHDVRSFSYCHKLGCSVL